jgi:hypothetical protein
LSKYLQQLCGFALKGTASTEHAVTHALGNSASLRVYCSAFHPRRNLWRMQWLPNAIDQQWLRGLHSWMAASSREVCTR